MNIKPVLTVKILAFIMILGGCVSLQSLTLDDNFLPESSGSYVRKIILFDKDHNSLNSWYSCVKGKPQLSLSESTIQVALKNTKGDCFGIYFDSRDISGTPIIKMKVKFQPSAKIPSVDILAGFTDEKNGKTYYPEKAKIIKFSGEFTDYYFDYSNEIKLSARHVDPSMVKTILIFVNILGVEDLSGIVSIEEVSLCKKASN